MAVNGEIGFLCAENNAEVFHGGNAEDSCRAVDNLVGVGENVIKSSIAGFHVAVVVNSVKARQIFGRFNEDFRIAGWEGSAAEAVVTDVSLDNGHNNTADVLYAGAVRTAVVTADDNVFGAVHLTHHLAQQESTAVIRNNVDKLAVFQSGNELFKERNMACLLYTSRCV